jgi:CHASE3 domain sensor protein
MRQINNRRNIAITLMLLLLVLAAFLYFAYRSIERTVVETRKLDNSLRSLRAMEDIRDDLQEIESAHRGFIISADTNFLAPYYNAVTSLKTDTVSIRSLSQAYPFRKGLYDRFISYVALKVQVSNISVELVKQNKRDSAIMRVSSGYGRKTMDSIRGILHAIELQDETNLRIANKERQIAAQSTAKWLVSLVSILLLGAFILGIQVFRNLRLRKVNEKKILYLAGLTEKTSDGIISINTKGAILSWNQGATNMFGFSGSEAVGKDISIITRKETEWSCFNETVSKKNIGSNIEWTCFNKSGQSIF